MRDQLAWLQTRDVGQCAAMAQGERPSLPLPDWFDSRRGTLRADALGERLPASVPPPSAGTRRFSIPAAAVAIAIRRSGLSEERLAAAWLNRGSDGDRCAAQMH